MQKRNFHYRIYYITKDSFEKTKMNAQCVVIGKSCTSILIVKQKKKQNQSRTASLIHGFTATNSKFHTAKIHYMTAV